ncbi:MAG: hypothetical protein ACRDGA_02295, partial [Bacteroidota bacterium]
MTSPDIVAFVPSQKYSRRQFLCRTGRAAVGCVLLPRLDFPLPVVPTGSRVLVRRAFYTMGT